jgi:hypothetical protein
MVTHFALSSVNEKSQYLNHNVPDGKTFNKPVDFCAILNSYFH